MSPSFMCMCISLPAFGHFRGFVVTAYFTFSELDYTKYLKLVWENKAI